jgi:hypothetical protein
MDYQVQKTCSWDEQFFQQFNQFRNEFYRDNLHYHGEDFSTLELLFKDCPPSEYMAILIKKSGKVCGRIVCSLPENLELAFVGFFECLEEPKVAKMLFREAESFALENDRKSLVGPIQFNIFISYRFKGPRYSKYFFNDPIHPNYYLDYFEQQGMEVVERWTNRKITHVWETILNFLSIMKKKATFQQELDPEEKKKYLFRHINLKQWDRELEIVHDLFMRSYTELPYYTPISLNIFKILYRDFYKIINPSFSHIIEYEGRPFAFTVNFFDPSDKILLLKKKFWEVNYLNLIRQKLLITYVGKVKIAGKDGKEYKGVQSHFILRGVLAFLSPLVKCAYVCLINDKSKALRSFPKTLSEVHAEYFLYRKELEV